MLHQVYPTSQKNIYRPSDIIEFQIVAPGLAIRLNDLTLSGTIRITNIDPGNTDIQYDSLIGLHGFVNNFSVSCQHVGVIENLSSYSRMVKMKRTATMAVGDIVNSLATIPELVCSDDSLTKYMMINRGALANNPITGNEIPFSLIPDICLNRAYSQDGSAPMLNWDAVGNIKLALRLCPSVECLYGANSPASSYEITDLRLEYRTSSQPAQISCLMQIITDVKQVINSAASQINVNLPLSIYSCSASFLKTDHENSAAYNNYGLETPPSVSQVFFQFNDATNGYVSYPLQSKEDILENYIDSFNSPSGKNCLKLGYKNSFGIGISFNDAVSLAGSSFGVNLTSSAGGANGDYYIFMYFRSLQVMPLKMK